MFHKLYTRKAVDVNGSEYMSKMKLEEAEASYGPAWLRIRSESKDEWKGQSLGSATWSLKCHVSEYFALRCCF